MKKKWIILCILIAVLLTACGGNAEEPVAVVEITETATLTPSATSTLTPTASPTITPTATITPTPTPSYQVLGPDNIDDWEIEEVECAVGIRCQLIDFIPASYQVVFASQLESSNQSAAVGILDIVTKNIKELDIEVSVCWNSIYEEYMSNSCTIGKVPLVTLSKDGQYLIYPDIERNEIIYAIEDGQIERQLPPLVDIPDPYGYSLFPVFSGVNVDVTRLIRASGNDPVIQIWDLETEELLFEFKHKRVALRNVVTILQKNEVVVVFQHANVQTYKAIVYDMETGFQTTPHYPFFQQDWVREFVFSDDGRLGAARIYNNKIYFLSIGDLEIGKILYQLELGEGAYKPESTFVIDFDMVFSPDNQWLFLTIVYGEPDGGLESYKRFVKILDVQSGEIVGEFEVPIGTEGMKISDDGKFIVLEGGFGINGNNMLMIYSQE